LHSSSSHRHRGGTVLSLRNCFVSVIAAAAAATISTATLGAQASASICKDGTTSISSGRGACSGHGGVDRKAVSNQKRVVKGETKAAKAVTRRTSGTRVTTGPARAMAELEARKSRQRRRERRFPLQPQRRHREPRRGLGRGRTRTRPSLQDQAQQRTTTPSAPSLAARTGCIHIPRTAAARVAITAESRAGCSHHFRTVQQEGRATRPFVFFQSVRG
jgi:hypothetical protein